VRNGSGKLVRDVLPQRKVVRCAIYTRKSTEEGLGQEFNSLDAQREAAEAFIASQRHEGWNLLPQRYDDGGFTGANLDRPAMSRLLADAEAGAIDCVVVYKVDRLSRSLVDFARMMEMFEKRGVAFVSITQQFNSANSIGRLTLNILLSFAQFEREIIAERTRDKMSAARRKGKWIGGIPVLGYDVDPRGGRLIVNEDEARRVRGMFELYLQHRALIPTVKAINTRRWTTKHWTTEGGREHPGKPIIKNLLYRTLTNPIYLGKVSHKGKVYDGEHEAIVDQKVWKRVNDLLQSHNVANGEKRNKHGALLRGLLCCEPCGVAMVHTYTVKGDRRYRYYSCLRKQQQGASACPSNRLAAGDIESAVVARIRGLGADPRIAAETYRKVQEQGDARRHELESDLRTAQKEIRSINQQLVRLAGANGNGRVERLADLQKKLRDAEQHIQELKKELASINGDSVGQDEVVHALSEFDGIWGAMNSTEQARLLHLLVERIEYDGASGKVSVTFRSAGFKALCDSIAAGAAQ
jgi:site-specific DNA recombinase